MSETSHTVQLLTIHFLDVFQIYEESDVSLAAKAKIIGIKSFEIPKAARRSSRKATCLLGYSGKYHGFY